MSANRLFRQQDKRDARQDIATQLIETNSEAEAIPQEEEAKLRMESELEEDRRQTILSGFDPDSRPLEKFKTGNEFEFALQDITFLSREEQEAAEAVRRQLPYTGIPWDVDLSDYLPSESELDELSAFDGVDYMSHFDHYDAVGNEV